MGDRAGVDDAEVRTNPFQFQGGVQMYKSVIQQSPCDLLGLVLIDLAAQGGKGELFYVAWFFHNNILSDTDIMDFTQHGD